MNKNMKVILITVTAIIVGAAAFTYGALTAPNRQSAMTTAQQPKQTPDVKIDLKKQLEQERTSIIAVLVAAYPKVKTDYAVAQGKLYDKGQWFGTTLTYKGKDDANRDTLRVLMEKKDGKWTLRTTPPQPLLSTVEYPDVPRSILTTINEPVSLPAGKGSPQLNAGE